MSTTTLDIYTMNAAAIQGALDTLRVAPNVSTPILGLYFRVQDAAGAADVQEMVCRRTSYRASQSMTDGAHRVHEAACRKLHRLQRDASQRRADLIRALLAVGASMERE